MIIAIIGGSFNPVHNGHIQIAEQLLEKGYVDEVIFVPCFKSLHGKEMVHGFDRIEMLDLIIDSSPKEDNLHLDGIEINEQMSGKTYNLVKYLRKRYCDELYFVIGMDNAINFEKYYKWEELLKMIPFIIIDRGGNLTLPDKFKGGYHKHITDVKVCGVSSSYIRYVIENMKTNGIPKRFFEYCNYDVFKYIIQNDLYLK